MDYYLKGFGLIRMSPPGALARESRLWLGLLLSEVGVCIGQGEISCSSLRRDAAQFG